ncbi:hypothetical protein EDB81DRAFT_82951 [Dactylonectria macrodidyma]|uniref:Uncharacterized protein n=1 Tax=Dactylonectria macrodidyma TaxID=307937 RepID=A0A9P9EG89_9HYPO|nr:hypothetical protein EDB81DRAFT_82951 [Dactylonectria macrodidyma]
MVSQSLESSHDDIIRTVKGVARRRTRDGGEREGGLNPVSHASERKSQGRMTPQPWMAAWPIFARPPTWGVDGDGGTVMGFCFLVSSARQPSLRPGHCESVAICVRKCRGCLTWRDKPSHKASCAECHLILERLDSSIASLSCPTIRWRRVSGHVLGHCGVSHRLQWTRGMSGWTRVNPHRRCYSQHVLPCLSGRPTAGQGRAVVVD